MQLEKYVERLRFIHDLISRQSTGNPSELATRLGVSKRMLHVYMGELKLHGAQIAFSRTRQTYYYKGAYKFENFFNEFPLVQ